MCAKIATRCSGRTVLGGAAIAMAEEGGEEEGTRSRGNWKSFRGLKRMRMVLQLRSTNFDVDLAVWRDHVLRRGSVAPGRARAVAQPTSVFGIDFVVKRFGVARARCAQSCDGCEGGRRRTLSAHLKWTY